MALLILILIGFCFYTVLRNQDLGTQVKKLETRLLELEDQIRRLHTKIVQQLPGFLEGGKARTPDIDQQTFKPATAPPPQATHIPPVVVPPPAAQPPKPAEPVRPQTPPPIHTPVLPAEPFKSPRPAPAHRSAPSFDFKIPSIDWEKFMGVQLFAWLGGFALFLGMAFFVKYSIDHNLVSAHMRVTIGFLIGVGTIIGGLSMRNKGYDVTVHTLAASGISILYADIFASRSLYNFLSPEMAFPCMILVTVTAFFLSVHLNSKYVAILGMVGGFLTPPMLSTGVDHPIALFSYILLLDVGLAAVTIRQRWGFLLSLSSVATFLMEAGWTLKFFSPEKSWLALGIYLTFGVFFLIVSSVADKSGAKDKAFQEPADYMPLMSMGFVGYLLSFKKTGSHPGVIFTLLFSNLALMGWRAIRRAESQHPYSLGAFISFALLAVWTIRYMLPSMAILTAGLYLALCAFTFYVSSRSSKARIRAGSVEETANHIPLAVFGLVAYFLTLHDLGEHPILIFSLIFALAALLSWRAICGSGSRMAYGLGVVFGFCLLAVWMVLI